jgi:hypothetical protein
MALSTYSGDTNYVSQLSDQPNDNEGLSAAELKGTFDKFGTEFKTYFNETHLPEVETAINAAASGIPTGGADASILLDGSITNSKLKSTSGSEAVDTNVIRDGAVTGDKLEASVKTAVEAVAGKASYATITVVLDKDDWSNSIQTVTATGVTAENAVIATSANDDASFTAWSNSGIHAVVQALNSLTFKCRSTPSSNVNVNILILK